MSIFRITSVTSNFQINKPASFSKIEKFDSKLKKKTIFLKKIKMRKFFYVQRREKTRER